MVKLRQLNFDRVRVKGRTVWGEVSKLSTFRVWKCKLFFKLWKSCVYRWWIEWITYCICCGVRSVQSSPVNLNLGKSSSWWYNLEGRKGLSTQIPIILTLKSWLSVHWKQSSSIKCTIGEIRWQILKSITNITLGLVNKYIIKTGDSIK